MATTTKRQEILAHALRDCLWSNAVSLLALAWMCLDVYLIPWWWLKMAYVLFSFAAAANVVAKIQVTMQFFQWYKQSLDIKP